MLRSRSGRLGAGLSAVIVLAALVSLVWTPYDPTQVNADASWAPLSARHPLGADRLGRDLLSQLLAGARITLLVAVGSTALAGAFGLVLALLATVTPRPVAEAVAHLVDILVAFPALLLALVLAAVFPGHVWTTVIALGLWIGAQVGRVTRAEIRRVLTADYVLAARASGAGTWRVIRRHLLPNITPALYVQLSLAAGVSVLAEAALSYLGLGTPPPAPSWGRSLHELQPSLMAHPLEPLWPGLAVVVTVLGFNLLGDGLREAADPRLRHPPRPADAPPPATPPPPSSASPATPLPDMSFARRFGGRCPMSAPAAGAPLLEVGDLRVRIGGRPVVDGVAFRVDAGERVGLIGESGSGKSLTALAVLGLAPEAATVSGSVRLRGRELIGRSDRELSRIRGDDVAMVFQEPRSALHPLVRVGRQIAEPLRIHRGLSRRAADEAAVELAARVGLPDPARLVRAYPHQLSGGQRQRVGLAVALACEPALILADEPTTALDVTVQAEMLALLTRLVDETGAALLFITHDLAVVAAVTHRLEVMRAGRLVESGPTQDLLSRPPRRRRTGPLARSHHGQRAGGGRRGGDEAEVGGVAADSGGGEESGVRHAVRDVSLTLRAGASLGIVGESGSGKSTLVRLLLGLDRADAGVVRYLGRPVRAGRPRDLRWLRRDVQVVLQDPVTSLNPRLTVEAIVAEPLECLRIEGDHGGRVDEVLRAVGLPPDVRRRYPHEFSGGQRQRIAIARALAPRPRILVGDEPVSALDVAVRAQILDLLAELTSAGDTSAGPGSAGPRTAGLSLILVSHDLGVVARLCDQVAVMRAGRIVERGGTDRVLATPSHPYTRALLAAVPRLPAPADSGPGPGPDPANAPAQDPRFINASDHR